MKYYYANAADGGGLIEYNEGALRKEEQTTAVTAVSARQEGHADTSESVGGTEPLNPDNGTTPPNSGIGTESPKSVNGTEPSEPTGMTAPPRPDTEYTKKMKEDFGFFGLVSFLYACFYAFCMYKNTSGITFPFFVAGSLLFFGLCLSRLEITLKKGSIFYMISMMLLAISTFSTDDSRIISLNKLGILLLLLSLMLKQLYITTNWMLGKYLFSMLKLLIMSIGEIGSPFRDLNNYRKKQEKEKGSKGFYVAAGFAFTIPLFGIILKLLLSADAVFRDFTLTIFDMIGWVDVIGIVMAIIFMFFAAYCILSFYCKKTISEEVKDGRKGEPISAITVTACITMLYLVFSGIQIIYLFWGKMQLPAGYTYAEYAREGFFQLLAVSILNLVIVLVCLSCFRNSRILKGILTVMSLCTYIMIASSALRMVIYIKYYYLTFLRILVLWALIVLFLLFTGVILHIFKEAFPLFGYSVVIVTICWLLLSYSHPDYFIAKVNLSNIEGQESSDFFLGEPYADYRLLSGLSADAAPALIPYLAENGYNLSVYAYGPGGINGSRYREDGFGYYYLYKIKQADENKSFRHFNISRYTAVRNIRKFTAPL